MIPTVLALGLAITAATQLRVGGLPIGPGEGLLLVWLVLAGTRHLMCRPMKLNPALMRVGLFWFVFAVTLCIGMIMGLVVEPFQYYAGILRDTAAYLFVFFFSIMLALSLIDAAERRQVAWSMAIVSSVMLMMQIADGLGGVPVPGVDPWYWDRFRGWTENPNQLGLFSLIVVLLCLHLAEQARTVSGSVWALALGVPALTAGVMSKSDSFVIGLMMSGALFTTLKSVAWIRDSDMAPTLRGAAVVLCLLALPLAAIVTVQFASAALGSLERQSVEVYDENGQGDTRLHLWAEAIEKGVESRLVGFGPGPHLTSKSYKRPPPNKFEAHNTFLDLFTQGGIVAVIAFFWISATALIGAARAGHPALAALVLGLVIFGMFHYMVRHPIFWFGIVFCLCEAARPFGAGLSRFSANNRSPIPTRAAPLT